MVEARVKAKKIYRNISKAGKKFTKVLGHDSHYYFYWEGHIADGAKEGDWLLLDIEKSSDEKGNFKVNRIVGFDADSGGRHNGEGSSPTDPIINPEPSYDIDEGLEEAVNRVKALLAEQPELAEVAQGLVAELAREQFALWQSARIEAMELRKIAAYGR